MNKAGLPFNILQNDEICCGSPILRTGDTNTYEEILNKNLNTIESKGIETVVFSCAGCYDTFKVDYPLTRKYDFEVKHTVESYFSNLS